MGLNVRGKISVRGKIPVRTDSALNINIKAVQNQLDNAVYKFIAANTKYTPKLLGNVMPIGFSKLVTTASSIVASVHSLSNLSLPTTGKEMINLNKQLVQGEMVELVTWAKSQGILRQPTVFERTWLEQDRIKGAENYTIVLPGNNVVQKTKALKPQENWLDYFQGLDAHAAYFKSTAYEFKGFVEHTRPNGDLLLAAVVEQKFIVGKKATATEVLDYMNKLGFVKEQNKAFIEQGITDSKWDRYRDPKTNITVYNIDSSNVLTQDNGEFSILDPRFDFSDIDEKPVTRDGGIKTSKGQLNEDKHYTIGGSN